MKTVLSIFRDDIRSIGRRFFALAIIVAISFLPALYAWVNIYANGNPYANTGSIPIAVASKDPGIDLEDGTHVNMAEEVFDDLRQSDKIGWQFPDSAEEAIDGVESGRYYAAIVFENNFTYNMYNFEQALLDQNAPITFYENTKKNAVAAKICETAAGNVQESIKTKYLETVFGLIFDETNEAADVLKKGDTVDSVLDQLRNLRDTLRSYDSAITSFTRNSAAVRAGLSDTGEKLASARSSAKASAANAEADLTQAKKSLEALRIALDAKQKQLTNEINTLEEVLKQLEEATGPEREQLEKDAKERADQLKADLEDMKALFPEQTDSAAAETVKSALDTMISESDSLVQSIPDASKALDVLETIKKLNDTALSEALDSMIKSMDTAIDQLVPLTKNINSMLGSIDPVVSNAEGTVAALDTTLLQMQKLFRASADDIDKLIGKVEAAADSDKLDVLITLLGGDPEQYAKFFSSLVDVEVEEVYSVASYGAAMAPFYSILAVWVGGVILVSILKTHIDRKKYPDATEAEAFFGRFLLFFLIGQAQAAVIVAGDIFLLHCEPVHPWLMWLSAAVASLVFVMLIYALTLSFGDIGKAMVVVVMVVQIAGSSGSYPIEILPPVFGKIYKFFPFPYAINAMREALCGTYGSAFVKYLGELLIFGVLALAIGLFVRKPFIAMNEFVSEKIEETEVL